MDNPFNILGITEDYARSMGQLDLNRRQSCLNHLRKYFNKFLHPDINGAPHIMIAKVNTALDTINTDAG